MQKGKEMENSIFPARTEFISSRANPKIKSASALLSARERKKTGLFLLEGARLCCDAAENGIEIKEFFATEGAAEKYRDAFLKISGCAKKVYAVSRDIAEKLSDTENTQEMFCVCSDRAVQPDESGIDPNGFYVMTENLQNPDNLGAVVRSAEALGADGLIVCSGCDIRSPKALRASMGGLLRFPVIRASDSAAILYALRKKGMKIFATVASGEAESIVTADKSGGAVCIIGNEGAGVSDEALALSTNRITIPMLGKAESLNASAAAAIAIWEFMKERGSGGNEPR